MIDVDDSLCEVSDVHAVIQGRLDENCITSTMYRIVKVVFQRNHAHEVDEDM